MKRGGNGSIKKKREKQKEKNSKEKVKEGMAVLKDVPATQRMRNIRLALLRNAAIN
jgi:hypothetical protein